MNPTLLTSAISYSEAGFKTTKLKGKRPVAANWPNCDYLFGEDLLEHFADWDGNIGVVLGAEDLVIDVDPRSFPKGRNPLKELMQQASVSHEALLDTAACIMTGAKGYHLYMKLPEGVKIKKHLPDFPGIDLLSKGHQVVAIGSKHPTTGLTYDWSDGRQLNDIRVAPQSLLDIITQQVLPEAKQINKVDPLDEKDLIGVADEVEAVNKNYIEYLTTTEPAVEGANGDDTTFVVAARGRDMGLSIERTLELIDEHYNPRCQPPWGRDELETKVKNAFSYAKNPPAVDTPERDFKVIELPDGRPALHPLWKGFDMKPGSTVKLKTFNNVFHWFLGYEWKLTDTVRWNALSQQIAIVKPLPWSKPNERLPRDWQDIDTIQLRLYLSKCMTPGFECGLNTLDQGVAAYAHTNPFHPLQDYLYGLKWDGRTRISDFMIKHAGAPNDEYTRATTRLMILQAVKRALHPGCKADYCVILEGEQGIGKTQLLQVLGGPWYADLVIDPHHKDCVDAMRGKWICEMSEMEVARRADVQALRAFITRVEDVVRLAYARHSISLPRSCVFIGSTNPQATGTYLTDTTGNRRFLPLVVNQVSLDAIAHERDQIFAEGVHLLKSGEPSWFTDPTILKAATAMQESRQVEDPWSSMVAAYVDMNKPAFITAKDIWTLCLGGNDVQLNQQQQRRISYCLKVAGYRSGTRRHKGRTQRGFNRCETK